MFSCCNLVSFQINFKLTQRKLYSFLSTYYYRFILNAVNNAEGSGLTGGRFLHQFDSWLILIDLLVCKYSSFRLI